MSTGPAENQSAAFEDIVYRLGQSGFFGKPDGMPRVRFGDSLGDSFPEVSDAVALVEFVNSVETSYSDDNFSLFDVAYAITIAIQEDDPGSRSERLSQLESAARNALTNVSLAGITQPTFTRLGTCSKPRDVRPPEGRIKIAGRFRYTIEGSDDRDEEDGEI